MICCETEDLPAMMGMVEGPVDDSLILDPIRRLCTLVDLARPYGISTNVPLPRFCRMLNDMYELAAVYTKEGSIEKAFVLYLRFVGIVVEELPKHRDFANFSLNDKDNFDRQTISAMNAAEVLKRRIKTMYEKQAQDLKAEIRAKDETKKENHSLVRPIPVTPPVLDLNLKSYVVCQKQVGYSLLFQRIIVPNDLPQRFIESFNESKDDANSLKFAVLYGRLLRNSLIVSHALIIDGSEPSFEQLDRCILEPDTDDPNESNELLLVGCVCGSLSDSSVEYFISRSLLTEIICIVCRQGDRQTYILHLSNLPERKTEEKGVSAETTATALEIEKARPIDSNESNFHSACQSVCSHTHITPTLSFTITDLRNSRENFKKMPRSSFSAPFQQNHDASMTQEPVNSVTKN